MLRFRYRTPTAGSSRARPSRRTSSPRYDARAIPVEPPEVWCAGVTYERSRDARVEESTVKDVYTLVYDAERPELFLKDAGCRRTVGPGEPIGVRADSSWDVPEPEIGVVLGEGGALAGLTIGNDVSSRAIEGENPLYLAQAKIVRRRVRDRPGGARPRRLGRAARDPACASPARTAPSSSPARRRRRRCSRSFAELVEWLLRDNPVPAGQRPAHRHRPRPARTTSRSSPATRSRSTCPGSAR